ncbi:MAG: N-acyl homoserine lactonase family protein [Candidatus Nanopelagicales bacterium]
MKTVVRKIYVMDGGTLTVEGSTLVPGTSFGQPKTIPVQFFLLETSKGYILVDTGNDPDVITDAVAAWGADLAGASNPRMDAVNHPYEQLKLLGLGGDDVKMVIYTHLHHDHCGGARFFPGALHVVQKAEHRWAFQPDSYFGKPYNQSDFRHDSLRWQLAEGDWCILPGVHLVSTPGHTPGHQSVVLWDAPDCGTVIIAGDAINCRENIEKDIPPGLTSDTSAAVSSMHRLTALASATDGSLLVSHEAGFFARLPKAPEPLGLLEPDLRHYYRTGVSHLYHAAANPDNVL